MRNTILCNTGTGREKNRKNLDTFWDAEEGTGSQVRGFDSASLRGLVRAFKWLVEELGI
jgi:hypothetical protein